MERRATFLTKQSLRGLLGGSKVLIYTFLSVVTPKGGEVFQLENNFDSVKSKGLFRINARLSCQRYNHIESFRVGGFSAF